MRLVMTLLVRDEEDIVEDNLRFHLAKGVDFFIATDNRSADRTPEILSRFQADGLLRLIHEPSDDYDQAAWVTRMARLAAADHGADWVINADADEFWWPLSGDLRSVLDAVPPDVNVVGVERANFPPVADETGPFHQRMIVRETVSCNILGQPLQPKVCHRGVPEVVVEQGNHDVQLADHRRLRQRPPLFILHYPLRSYQQYEQKTIVGGQAYARNTKVPWVTGSGWRLRYEDYQAGRLRSFWDEQLMDDGAVHKGIGEGRLIIDRRLQAFFGGRAETVAPGRRVAAAPRPPRPMPSDPTPASSGPAAAWRRRARRALGRVRRLTTRVVKQVRPGQKSA